MLMKGLEGAADRDGNRQITAAELHAYVTERVNQESLRLGHKQTPVMSGDGTEILAQW